MGISLAKELGAEYWEVSAKKGINYFREKEES